MQLNKQDFPHDARNDLCKLVNNDCWIIPDSTVLMPHFNRPFLEKGGGGEVNFCDL